MPRGGYRENAGRKSSWASGWKYEETTVIRVPKEYAAQLLEIAHKLDAGVNVKVIYDSPVKKEVKPGTQLSLLDLVK